MNENANTDAGSGGKKMLRCFKLLCTVLFVAAVVVIVIVAVVPGAAVRLGVTPRGHTKPPPFFEANGAVSKTVVSNKMRLVFAVGLEGSGHNYLARAFITMFGRNNETVTRLDACRVSWEVYQVRAMNGSPEHYAEALERAKEKMRALAGEEEKLTSLGGIATMFQLDSPPECKYLGMLSYPNFTGSDKVFRYVDLRMVAEMAEAAGVDFRVVYLKRSARDMMIANTVHRNFHNQLGQEAKSENTNKRYMRYSRVLFTDIAVMQSMMSELGPGFTVCHSFDKLGQPEQASKVADFIAPNEDVADMVVDVMVDTVRTKKHGGNATTTTTPTREELLLPGAEGLAERFQKKLDAFESRYC